MIEEVSITKRKGIDTFVSNYTPEKVEEGKELILNAGDPEKFKRLLEVYEEMLPRSPPLSAIKFWRLNSDDVLSPQDIDLFLTSTTRYKKNQNYHKFTGIFVSYLLARSSKAGHNDFRLRPVETIHRLANVISGRQDYHLNLTIKGNVGPDCAYGVNHINLSVEGDILGEFAQRATNSVLTFHGRLMPPVGYDARYCTFRTTNEDLLRLLKDKIEFGNRIIYIHENGEEEMLMDYVDFRRR